MASKHIKTAFKTLSLLKRKVNVFWFLSKHWIPFPLNVTVVLSRKTKPLLFRLHHEVPILFPTL